jgi:hypothetical protein
MNVAKRLPKEVDMAIGSDSWINASLSVEYACFIMMYSRGQSDLSIAHFLKF